MCITSRQLFRIEAHLGARGEMFEPEVDRVGAGFNGRAQLRPVSGGAHDLGLAHAFSVTEGWFGKMRMGFKERSLR